MTARPMLTVMLVASVLTASCRSRVATREDCQQILDRLVDLELQEKGFRDPVVADRWRREAETVHAADLAGCVGQRLPRDAMTCVQAARSSEQIAHDCLR